MAKIDRFKGLKVKSLKDMKELHGLLLSEYDRVVNSPAKMGVTGANSQSFRQRTTRQFVDSYCKDLGRRYVPEQRINDWNLYCENVDGLEISDVVVCMAGLNDGISFEDVAAFLNSTSSDMFHGIAESNAIALFSEKGVEFFKHYHKSHEGHKFQSPVEGLNITLEDIELQNNQGQLGDN